MDPASDRLERNRRKLNHSTARTVAALFGTLPVALGSGLALAQALPLSAPQRYLVGNFSVFPLWVALCLWVLLAPSGKRAWLALLVLSGLIGVVLAIGRSTGSGLLSSGGP